MGLKIEKLKVSVEGKLILKGINLSIPKGETHLLLGPNGCGKTTLLMTLMGYPQYKIEEGKILFNDIDITNIPMNERAKLGIGVSFQKPPSIKGVSVKKLLSVLSKGEENINYDFVKQLKMIDYLERDINFGFSGGEIKRSELLQILHQNPNFVMLDEPESGVDIENLKLLGSIIGKLLEKPEKIKDRTKMGLIITHTGYILDYIEADRAHVMINGKIICNGNAHEVFQIIQKHGFKECELCQAKK